MSIDNPEIILGPPGTGKTTRALQIVEQELERGVPPDRVGYVSFTRKAAHEAADRAAKKFGLSTKDFPYCRTLHSLCFRELGMSRGDIMEGKRVQEFAEYAGVRITGRFSEDGTLTGFDKGDRILFMENLSRIRRVPLRALYDEDDDQLAWSEVDRVSRALVAFKNAHGVLDYTDLLSRFVLEQVQVDLDVLIVDEAQDLSALQWQVVAQLARGCRRVIVAGDDDQAIYRWAGADVDHLINMAGQVQVLNQSWRVPE